MGKRTKRIPTQKAIPMHEKEKVAVTMAGGARYAERDMRDGITNIVENKGTGNKGVESKGAET